MPEPVAMGDIVWNVGCDVEDIERFLAEGSALDPLFTLEEIDYCGPLPGGAGRRAGTWCAKEATVKALWPWVRLDPRRVIVTHTSDGIPEVRVDGALPSGVDIRISIAHSRASATATAVVWGPAPGTPRLDTKEGVRK
jgi:holo-[acyl-carrier protein] synthase